MPGRTTPFINQYFYHIYNRGNEKRDIFSQLRDYERFKQTFFYYQFFNQKVSFSKFTKSRLSILNPLSEEKSIDIICFCLMPNHFHFLTRQLKDDGISSFISKLANSYTKYFNTKYNRVGALFQGAFKAVRIESDEQLIHVSRYIHLNPVVSGLVKRLATYKWSSYQEYLRGDNLICTTSEILNFFPRRDYQEFVESQADFGTTLEILKHNSIDNDDL